MSFQETRRAAPGPARAAVLPPGLAHFTPFGVFQAIRRRWALACGLGLAAGALAVAITLVVQPAASTTCTAQALLRVHADRGTVATLIRSRLVLDDVLRKDSIRELSLLAAQPDPRRFLRDNLEIDFGLGSEVLRVSLRGDRPEEVAVLVNEVAQTALEKLSTQQRREKEDALRKLEKAHEDYSRTVAGRRERIAELARPLGGVPSAGLAPVLTSLGTMRLSALQAEWAQTERDLRGVRLQLEQRRETTAAAPPPAPLPAGVVHAAEPLAVHPQVQTVSAEIRKVDAEIQQIRAVAVSPEVAREIIDRRGLPRQRRELEQALLELTGKAPPAGIVPVAGPAPPAPQGIEPLQAQAALLEKNRHELQKQIEELTRELKEMATAAAEIETIQKEIDPIDSANRSVAAELDRLRRDMDAPEPITLIETADVPRVQVERRFPYPALAGVGAFVLTLVGIGVVESRKRRVYTVRDVVQGLEIPVIGTHAYLSTRPEGNGQQPWFARPDDAVDAVRALLLHQSGSGSLARVVLIASSVGGEGATTAAVELAASLARAGRRTLLVDAHLRRPAAHRAFGLPEGPGLSEVLRGEMSGPAAVRAAPLDRLWLLPAGRADLQAIEVLSRDGARGLLEQWKKDYDFIVFDGAPVAAAADALVLLQRADAVILSVLAGVSRLPAVHAAWQRLSALDARLLGAVVHGAGEDISSLS